MDQGTMGGAGSALDNATSESFVASLKTEFLHRPRFPSREAARTTIFDYIESYYNRTRRLSSLGYLSPSDYEQVTRYNRGGCGGVSKNCPLPPGKPRNVKRSSLRL